MAELKRCSARIASRARLKPRVIALAFMMSASLALLIKAPTARLDAPDVYAIKDAQIVAGNGKTIAKGTVVIRDGLITEVGDKVKIPADARVIEGAGLTVYPGLIDAYTDLGMPPAAPAAGQGRGAQASQASQASAEERQDQKQGDPSEAAADMIKAGGTAIEDARSAGITTALTNSRQGIFAGQSALINLAGDDTSKLVVRAPVALTVQFSTGGGFLSGYPNSLMGTVAFIRQSFYDALHYRDEVERYNRAKRGVPRPEYDKKLEALQPALKGDLPVLFIANSDGDIRRALMIANEFKLKPIIEGALFGYRVADMLKAQNVPVILSVDFPKRAADLPEDEDEPLRVLRERAETPKGAAKLAQAKVKFAFASGALKPRDFLINIQKAVDSGLSKEAALQALTINAAEILGAGDQLGTVEVGKIANLVITKGDLLAKDTKIEHVFIDGNEVELKKPEAKSPGARPGERAGEKPGASPATVNPSGNWELIVASPRGDLRMQLSLSRQGDDITGRLNGPAGESTIENATLEGDQLRFTTHVTMGADTMEAVVSGTIEGNSMRGSFALTSLGTFNFTGNRPR